MPYEKIEFLAQPKFNPQQILELGVGFLCGHTIEQLNSYGKGTYEPEKMAQAKIGLSLGLNEEEMKFCMKCTETYEISPCMLAIKNGVTVAGLKELGVGKGIFNEEETKNILLSKIEL